MDITYVPMARGFIYLAAVMDWFSRRVLFVARVDHDGGGILRRGVREYEEVYLRAYDSVDEARASLSRTSTSTTAIGLIRALTDARPIKPTSTRCLSARRPNPGRGSTYRCGNSVQTTAATSPAAACPLIVSSI
jgi:hypothetical protein